MYGAGLPHGNRIMPGGIAENGKIIARRFRHTAYIPGVKKARTTDGNNITLGTNNDAREYQLRGE